MFAHCNSSFARFLTTRKIAYQPYLRLCSAPLHPAVGDACDSLGYYCCSSQSKAGSEACPFQRYQSLPGEREKEIKQLFFYRSPNLHYTTPNLFSQPIDKLIIFDDHFPADPVLAFQL